MLPLSPILGPQAPICPDGVTTFPEPNAALTSTWAGRDGIIRSVRDAFRRPKDLK
jgi:hypothetical protein